MNGRRVLARLPHIAVAITESEEFGAELSLWPRPDGVSVPLRLDPVQARTVAAALREGADRVEAAPGPSVLPVLRVIDGGVA